MSTTTVAGAGPADPTAPGDTPAADPQSASSDRGGLSVADRVVEKVAGYAVTLVPDAAAAPRRVLGVNVGESREEGAASVEARVIGDVATVSARIAVRWPRSVPEVADAVRRRIRKELTEITGVRVDHIDVEVSSLSVGSPERRRVE
ncbi:MAG: Asp23/Gls24 family envelope stress response protein [Intrasporangium sp.]|uniref:Asp23/Gls24 family envelope stress response protein n=1 Tax=Intrasporangium sp. TaxID=1925024 RepID=UPI003F81645C